MNQFVFYESQKFFQWWLWLLIIGLAVIGWWGFIQQNIMHKPFGSNPGPDWAMILIWLLIGIGLPLTFLFGKMETKMTEQTLSVQVIPFQIKPREIEIEHIVSAETVDYNALKEYGGYGIRLGTKGMAYNASGKEGVRITLDDGRKILIGSHLADELGSSINKLLD